MGNAAASDRGASHNDNSNEKLGGNATGYCDVFCSRHVSVFCGHCGEFRKETKNRTFISTRSSGRTESFRKNFSFLNFRSNKSLDYYCRIIIIIYLLPSSDIVVRRLVGSVQVNIEKKKLSSYGSVEQSGKGFVNAGLNVNGGYPEPAPPTDNPSNPFLAKSTNPFASVEWRDDGDDASISRGPIGYPRPEHVVDSFTYHFLPRTSWAIISFLRVYVCSLDAIVFRCFSPV